MAIKSWSTTPGDNDSASPNGWPENMAPSGVNDTGRQNMADVRSWYEDMEWRDWGHTVTRTGNTTFTVATDVTAIYAVNRPIRCTDATTLYGYVSASSYSAPNTTVTVTLDSGNLSASLTAVSLGVTPSTKSIPASAVRFDSSTTFSAVQYFTAGIGPHFLNNIGLTAAVAAKALTIALKTKALADASASDPAQIAFRNATATTGDYSVVNATAATSVVVPSGGTLGFTAAEDGLIYVYAINNAGTVELAVAKKALFDESRTHDTTAIGTGSDSDNVLYSTSARTGVAVRLIGRIRITTGAVAGEWDNEDTRIEVWTPSMKKTGDEIQTVRTDYSAVATGTTLHAYDDTIPQNTEGDEYMVRAITPTSSINPLEIDAIVVGADTTAQRIVYAMFQDSTADAIAVVTNYLSSANGEITTPISHSMTAGTTSSTTFKIRVGGISGGTFTFNGSAAARKFGGKMASFIRVREIQA